MCVDRRTVIAFLTLLPTIASSEGRTKTMTVHRDPSCGCCEAWVDHVRAAGFDARIEETSTLNSLKAKLGVPVALRSCHTAELDGYLIEGHVPAAAITRLLSERPRARGLAVPGMPVGSPGMEVEGAEPVPFDVILFDEAGVHSFMRFRGDRQI